MIYTIFQVYSIVFQLYIHIHTYIFFLDNFPFRLLHNVEYSSLCSTVGHCWFSKIVFYVSIFSITIRNRTHNIMSCHVLLGHFSHTIWSQYLIAVCFVWLVHADVLIVEFHILIFFITCLLVSGWVYFLLLFLYDCPAFKSEIKSRKHSYHFKITGTTM